MSDRIARAARERYVDHLRRCTGCITPSILLVTPYDAPRVWQAKLATNPARLPTAPHFTVEITHEFTYQPMGELEAIGIRPIGYRYELNYHDGRELLAYHLHPVGRSQIKHPHLHVGTHDPSLNYGKKNLVTGFISLPEIILCLITEFDIPPIRPDWRDILTSETGTIRTATQD